jgi:hypothetical protein
MTAEHKHRWVWFEEGYHGDSLSDGYAACEDCKAFSWWPEEWGWITKDTPPVEQLAYRVEKATEAYFSVPEDK